MGAPDVSIVIPCHNRENLVGAAIESALAQQVAAEIIVVDDGSTDRSWSMIEGFGDRIRAFRQANAGVSAARNHGVEQARGRFIRFLDSDDRIPAGALAAHLAAAQALRERQIAVGDAASIGPDGRKAKGPGYGYAGLVTPGPIPREVAIGRIMSPWLPLFPAAALKPVGGFDTRFGLAEDHELASRLLCAGWEFVRVPVTVCEVREHECGRLSRGFGGEGYERLYAVFRQIWLNLRECEGRRLEPNEGIALGRMVWTSGRDASREGFSQQANALFRLAEEIGGAEARQGAPALRLLYHLLAPYPAERLLMGLKRLVRR